MIKKYCIRFKLIFSFLLLFACPSLIAQESLCVKTFKGKAIAPYVNDITDLCLIIYKEYPYCYEGTEEEYLPFIKYYAESESGVASILFDNGRPVGVAIGMPMNEMREKYKGPFTDARPQESINDLFYLGEFLLRKEYRGKGYGKDMLLEIERSVKDSGNLKKICFCKIDETESNPSAPEKYQPLDPFWKKQGFNKCDDVTVTVYWQNVGEADPSPHKLVYWLQTR